MRGRDDAHVGAALLAAAHALERALLEHAQQLHLHVEAHVADLVQEQRAAVGELEAADARGQRARESALLVAEQLALEQLARNRAAVDGHERPPRARRKIVNAPCDELLAATGLAANQYRAVVTRDLPHQLVEPVDGGRRTDRKRSTCLIGSDHSLHLRGLLPLASPRRAGSPKRPRTTRCRTTHCFFSGFRVDLESAPRVIHCRSYVIQRA